MDNGLDRRSTHRAQGRMNKPRRVDVCGRQCKTSRLYSRVGNRLQDVQNALNGRGSNITQRATDMTLKTEEIHLEDCAIERIEEFQYLGSVAQKGG